MDNSSWFQSSQSQLQTNHKKSDIVIGYYNIRGKAQVPRLLLEYLQVQYEDKIFTLQSWQKYCTHFTQHFAFTALPFLKENNFVCTDSVPMCTYIINRYGDRQLLGRNLKDRAIIEMYFWTIPYMQNVITINCQQMSPQQLKKFKSSQWQSQVYPRILKMQEYASNNRWFLDYLTIIDFSIYELIKYMDKIFDGQTASLPKLKRIQQQISNLQSIKRYENSNRAITEWCPTKLLQSFRAMTNNQNKSEK